MGYWEGKQKQRCLNNPRIGSTPSPPQNVRRLLHRLLRGDRQDIPLLHKSVGLCKWLIFYLEFFHHSRLDFRFELATNFLSRCTQYILAMFFENVLKFILFGSNILVLVSVFVGLWEWILLSNSPKAPSFLPQLLSPNFIHGTEDTSLPSFSMK